MSHVIAHRTPRPELEVGVRLLATSLEADGVVGLVIDAGIRDTTELTVKASPGWVNIPVVCAGAIVHPGDVIVGDTDGVVVVPRAKAAEVARLGEQRRAKEDSEEALAHSGVRKG